MCSIARHMNKGPSKQHKERSDHYLHDSSDWFCFDLQSGLHIPKSYKAAYKTTKERLGSSKGSRFFTNPKEGPFALLISFGTLVLVAATAYFTAGQMLQAKRTADASICSANAAMRAAVDAETSNLQSAINFRTDERAWVEIGKIQIVSVPPPSPPFPTIFKFSIYPTNAGRT